MAFHEVSANEGSVNMNMSMMPTKCRKIKKLYLIHTKLKSLKSWLHLLNYPLHTQVGASRDYSWLYKTNMN